MSIMTTEAPDVESASQTSDDEQSELRRTHAEAEGHLNCQIRRLVAARDAANRLIDSLAHESRTPLTVVQEYCSLVRDGLAGPVTEQQSEYLSIAMARVRDLGALLNDFVDASWLDSGAHRLRPQPVRLVEVVDRVEAALQAKATTAHVRLEFRVSRDLPDVYCDPDVIGRVIAGITSLAIRSTCDEGVIRIWAEQVPDQRQVLVVVADLPTGGKTDGRELIPPLSEIFSDDGTARFSTGSFSVAIAKTLVRASLSELRMQRNGEHGTAYFFGLPEADPESVMARYIHYRQTHDGGMSAVAIIQVSLDEESGNGASDALDEMLFNTIAGGDLGVSSRSMRMDADRQRHGSGARVVGRACARSVAAIVLWTLETSAGNSRSDQGPLPHPLGGQQDSNAHRRSCFRSLGSGTPQTVHPAGRRRSIDHRRAADSTHPVWIRSVDGARWNARFGVGVGPSSQPDSIGHPDAGDGWPDDAGEDARERGHAAHSGRDVVGEPRRPSTRSRTGRLLLSGKALRSECIEDHDRFHSAIVRFENDPRRGAGRQENSPARGAKPLTIDPANAAGRWPLSHCNTDFHATCIMEMKTILVADDDPALVQVLELRCRASGSTFASPIAASPR